MEFLTKDREVPGSADFIQLIEESIQPGDGVLEVDGSDTVVQAGTRRRRSMELAIRVAWCRLFSMKMRPTSVPPRIAPAR
jgi:hypothetical protein